MAVGSNGGAAPRAILTVTRAKTPLKDEVCVSSAVPPPDPRQLPLPFGGAVCPFCVGSGRKFVSGDEWGGDDHYRTCSGCGGSGVLVDA